MNRGKTVDGGPYLTRRKRINRIAVGGRGGGGGEGGGGGGGGGGEGQKKNKHDATMIITHTLHLCWVTRTRWRHCIPDCAIGD